MSEEEHRAHDAQHQSGAPRCTVPLGSIPSTAIHFTTHSNLTLNASKLMEIIQLLINGHNAHESQILDLQQQLRQMHPGGVPQASEAASPSVGTPQNGRAAVPSSSSTMQLVDTAVSGMSSPPPRVPSPAAPAKKAAGRKAPLDGTDDNALHQSVAQLQQVLGLQTQVGQRAVKRFGVAMSGIDAASPTVSTAYTQLLDLPLMSALKSCLTGQQGDADGPSSNNATDAIMVQLRGLEGQVAVLSNIVESLQQQVSSVAGAAVGSSRKSNTAQRSPLVSSLASSAGGQIAVDAAARVDVARLSKELQALHVRVQAVAAKQATIEAAHSTSDDDDDASSQNGDGGTGPKKSTLSRKHQAAALSVLSKRVDALEKSGPKKKSIVTDASACKSPELSATNGATLLSSGVSKDVAAEHLAAVTHTPPPWEAALRTVEDTALIGIRKAKDAILGSLAPQLDVLSTNVHRLMEWIDTHEAMHEQLLHEAREMTMQGVSRAASFARPGDEEGLAPRRPASATLLASTSASPYVPKRDAVVRAAAASARFSKSQALVGGRPVDNQRPLAGEGNAKGSGGMLFRLFHGAQSVGGGVDVRGGTAAASSPIGSAGGSPAALRKEMQNSTGSAATAHAHHDPSTCVVWKCGWCASSRDQAPSWCNSPTPPHR